MSAIYTCDACGKTAPGVPCKSGLHAKPDLWWQRPTKAGGGDIVIEHACSLECREKLSDAKGRILVPG